MVVICFFYTELSKENWMDREIEKLLNSKEGEAFRTKLFCAAQRILADDHLAQDVVQDTFEYFAGRDVPVKNPEEVLPYNGYKQGYNDEEKAGSNCYCRYRKTGHLHRLRLRPKLRRGMAVCHNGGMH